VPALLEEHDRRAVDRYRTRLREQARTRPFGRFDERPPAAEVGAELVRSRDPEPRAGLLEDLPAQGRPLIDERDRQTGGCRLDGGGEPRRAAADDEEIGRLGFDQWQAGIGGSGAPIVAL
jgi:hypothetical protein